jgi:hypothetical protein
MNKKLQRCVKNSCEDNDGELINQERERLLIEGKGNIPYSSLVNEWLLRCFVMVIYAYLQIQCLN